MTQSVRTMPARPGDVAVAGERRSTRLARQRSSTVARRRWLILFAVVVLVVVAILANIGPLTHYQAASARLDGATAKVDTLTAQKADLQGQLAKLTESGYLETLARQQLTYVRPGEELYIVTNDAGATEPDGGAPVGGAAGAAASNGGTGTTAGSGIGAAAVSDLGVLAIAGGDDINGATTSSAAAGTSVSPAGANSSPEGTAAGTEPAPGFFERALSAIRGLF
jgi:cell division protein FtsB